MIHFFVEEGKVNLAFKNKITFKFNFLGKVWSDDFFFTSCTGGGGLRFEPGLKNGLGATDP